MVAASGLDVQSPTPRLRLLASVLTRDPETSVESVAEAAGCSRTLVYTLLDRAGDAVMPRDPGRPARTHDPRDQAALTAMAEELDRARCALAALEQRLEHAVEITPTWRDRLTLALFDHDVSCRGIAEVLALASDWCFALLSGG